MDISNSKVQTTLTTDSPATEETFAAHLSFGEALQFSLKRIDG
jgi:hypothetical protein